MTRIVNNAPPFQPVGKWIAVDLEISQADKKILHRPITGKFALCTFYDGEDDVSYVVRDEKHLPVALNNIKNAVWIFHNAKFDLTHLRRWATIFPRNKIWDTYLIEKILWGGYYDEFALDDLARRYLSIKVDKSLQKAWEFVENAYEISDEMLQYAVIDSKVDWQICMEQRKHVQASHWKIWKEIDLPCMWAIMDFQGFRLDWEKWAKLAETNLKKADEYDAQIPFNPRSPKVVKDSLLKLGFKGLPDSKAATLERWLKKYPDTEAAKLCQLILDSRTYRKRASTYGTTFIRDYLEDEGEGVKTITCSYNITAAETGRISASAPAMHQIPARETNEFRECFIARPNHKIIVVDFSQQEIGIIAYVSQDKAMMEICNSGGDIYIASAKTMYGQDITKHDPLRKIVKSTILGLNYGMSEFGLAKRLGISEQEAADIIYKFKKAFPQLSSWMSRQERIKSKVYTVEGRTIHLNPYSGQCDRNAKNGPIQGTAADMMKRTIGEVHKNWPFQYPVCCVGTVHDELVLDAPDYDAEDVAKFVSDTAVRVANTMCPGMSFRVSCSVGSSWAEK